MSIAFDTQLHPLGTHRVIEPAGAMPQSAWKIDNTPIAFENEILCDVEVLNIDSASFKQIADACDGDAENDQRAHARTSCASAASSTIPSRAAAACSSATCSKSARRCATRSICKAGDRIASLVSLTLTPLHIEAITRIDVATGRVWIRGKAILFESGLWAKLPDDIDENVALAVLDVAGAPAQVQAACASPGRRSSSSAPTARAACSRARKRKRASVRSGSVIGVAPSDDTPSAQAA